MPRLGPDGIRAGPAGLHRRHGRRPVDRHEVAGRDHPAVRGPLGGLERGQPVPGAHARHARAPGDVPALHADFDERDAASGGGTQLHPVHRVEDHAHADAPGLHFELDGHAVHDERRIEIDHADDPGDHDDLVVIGKFRYIFDHAAVR